MQRNSHRMTNLKFKLVFGLSSLLLLGTPIYGQIIDQSLCIQCLTTAKAELKKCLEAAISQEDKKSCQEKQEKHAKTCVNECKIAKAAEDAIIREGNPQLIELLSNK
jgi:hypothetical protein